jgi:alkylated DNA nucleotide flippase Atl1
VPGAKVDQYEALARVTIPPRDDQQVGRVLRMMRNADLAWLG